jgi:hypothetical protein
MASKKSQSIQNSTFVNEKPAKSEVGNQSMVLLDSKFETNYKERKVSLLETSVCTRLVSDSKNGEHIINLDNELLSKSF